MDYKYNITDIKSRRFTPQEKKRKRYLKDRRNDYGENDKGSRKSIRLRKKWVNQNYRSNIHNRLKLLNEIDPDSSIKSVKRIYWKKSPDISLIDHIKRQKSLRLERYGRKKRTKFRLTEY